MNLVYHKKISFLFIYCVSISSLLFAEISRDLELDKLYTVINYTHTEYGNQALQTLLAHPTNNVTLLRNRQTIIRNFVNNQPLHEQLSSLLHKFNLYEPYFTYLLHETSDLQAVALEEFYFSQPYFQEWNYSPIHLELGQCAYFGNLCSSLIQHSLAFALFTWGLEEEHTCAVHPSKKHKHHHEHNCNHHSHHITHNSLWKTLAQSKEFRYFFQLWHGVAQIQEIYSIQAIIRNHLRYITELQKQLIHITYGMHTLKKIHSLLTQYPEITALIPSYQNFTDICLATNISTKLQKLLVLLNTNTFQGQASIFSRTGIILAAYKLMQEIGDELQPALTVVGEIDAYASCAQLLKNNQSDEQSYCFAQYSSDEITPTLQAYNFWHPLTACQNIQLNTISLGGNETVRHIILTGPNASGKSTILKALTVCAYFAQTITIVPAQKYSQTLFKEIYSSMIITDNITDNMSLFATELTNAETLLTTVENLKDGEYMLIVLDELFKSTHHEKGQKIARNLLEILYSCPHIITLVSTHFEKLTELTDTYRTASANYTINNFVLEPGIAAADSSFDIVQHHVKSRLMKAQK